jgi:diaminopropionate ammonia-lyase
VLGNPLDEDPRIVSGESGAIGMGVLAAAHFAPDREALLRRFKLDRHSVVLLISTEGDTDRKRYREIAWEGRYPCA